MPELAKHVTVDLAQKKLYVNGEEFPFYIAEGGIRVDGLAAEVGGLATVTVTFFTEDIEVVPASRPASQPGAVMNRVTSALLEEGRQLFEAAQLVPILHRDLGTVVEAQLRSNREDNARLVIWLLNHGSALLDAVATAQQRLENAREALISTGSLR